MTSREALARLIRAEIDAGDWRQYEVATEAGITEKHLSQIVNLKAGVSLNLVDQILAACGRRLILATVPIEPEEE